MKIADLRSFAADKTNFLALSAYFDFAQRFLDFRANGGFQAEIVAQNEQVYRFFQYQADAGFQVTRPNSRIRSSAPRAICCCHD